MKVNILFLGGLYHDNLIKEIRENTKNGFQYAANTFQWALVNGLKKVPHVSLDICSMPFIGYFPVYYKRVKVREWGSIKHSNSNVFVSIGFLNLPILKNIYRYYRSREEICRWTLDHDANPILIIYSANLAFLKAALDVKKMYSGLHICTVITDLPVVPHTINLLQLFTKRIQKQLIYKYLKLVDSYVLLTEEMAKVAIDPVKPYRIIEGIYDYTEQQILNVKKSTYKVVMYAGNLDERCGIEDLLIAFSLINDDNYRLWICGDGNMSLLVMDYCNKDPRITYWGVLDRPKVLELEASATVLINPRSGKREFTKYSFPSKTIEYMASGTPVIIKKLPGIPVEYYQYCYIIEGETPHDIAIKVIEVCSLSQETHISFGNKARQFILDNKASVKQAEKIVKMISSSMQDVSSGLNVIN